MLSILNDSSKFQFLADLSFDDSLKMEIKSQKWLLKLYKSKFISKEILREFIL